MNACTRSALVAAWLLVGLSVTGRADTSTSNFTVKGDTLTATFQATDPQNPCVETQVLVVGSELMQKLSPDGGPETEVRASLVVTRIDACQGIDFIRGVGDVAQAALQVAGGLESATLRATVPVFDEVSQQLINFAVNLTWTATGEPVFEHFKERIRDRELGLLVVAQSRGRHAPAVASGTVVALGGFFVGQNFTPQPSFSAEIQTQNDGTVTIQVTR